MKLHKTVYAAMFAALTLLATSVLKIQTPAFGYIHLGDAFVLLAGLFLGPFYGGLAAGIGSALSDLLGGYVLWVPGTFLIKYLTAATAAALFQMLETRQHGQTGRSIRSRTPAIILAGITGEAVMVTGYFFFNILVIMLTNGGFTAAGLASALSLSIADIPFNAVQGSAGILLSVLLYPALVNITTGVACAGNDTSEGHPQRR